MNEDRIEREIVINASVERVWAVLTEPEHVTNWFSTGAPAEVDLRPGGIMKLTHGDWVFPTTIVKVDPPHYFAYRWASGFAGEVATEENATLVEFSLAPEGTGTRLRLVESGFASIQLPAESREHASWTSHSEGWTAKMGEVREYAEKP